MCESPLNLPHNAAFQAGSLLQAELCCLNFYSALLLILNVQDLIKQADKGCGCLGIFKGFY